MKENRNNKNISLLSRPKNTAKASKHISVIISHVKYLIVNTNVIPLSISLIILV